MGKKLFVGNLPFSASEASLTEIFSQVGQVESAKIITDRETGRSKGFGFVEMTNDADAVASITKFHGADYDGRTITVAEAKPASPREQRSGGFGNSGDRGGFGRRKNY